MASAPKLHKPEVALQNPPNEAEDPTNPTPAIAIQPTRVDRYRTFMNSEQHSDIAIIVGKDKIPIKCHKMILIFGSPYFEEHLIQKLDNGSIAIVEELADGVVTTKTWDTFVIEEVEPSDFRLFLKFLYSGIYPTNVEEALPLMNCASIFGVSDLSDAAGNLLKATLSPESAPTIFQQACHFNNIDLQRSASDFICRGAYKIVNVAQFGLLKPEALAAIIKRDDVRVYDEMQLFEAVLSWAKEECVRQNMDYENSKYVRSVLEPVLKYVRFPQMTAEEFSLKVARSKILTSDEIVDVLPYFNLSAAKRPSLTSEFFNSTPREYYLPSGPVQIVKRLKFDLPIATAKTTANTDLAVSTCCPETRIYFKTNKSVWISSIGLTPCYSGSVSVKAKVEIRTDDEDEDGEDQDYDIMCMAKEEAQISDDRITCTHVKFKKPVKINNSEWYTIFVSVRLLQGTYKLQTPVDYEDDDKVTCGEDGEDDPLIFYFIDQTEYTQIAEIGYQLED